jgi:hypothetical protein
MLPTKPDLTVLPFKARQSESDVPLTFDQTLALVRAEENIQIERSHPGAPDAIGWTIFRRTLTKYLYEDTPHFRFERGARRYIRKAYAMHYSRASDDDPTLKGETK